MVSYRTILLTGAIVLAADSAVGAPASYTRNVAHVYALILDGDLEISAGEQQIQGSVFSVSRVTGEITGEVLPTTLATKAKVINQGSDEYSFKAISEFEVVANGRQIQLIEVQEFRESPVKPFVAMSMGGAGLVTGSCR